MLRVGICDDEREMRFGLRCKMERILEAREVDCETYEFSSGDRLLSWYAKHAGTLDLLFLDIEMNGHNGMETAKELRLADSGLQLVFVTGHPDYVFDGYAVGALDYMMKPPTSEKLYELLTRALTALHMGEGHVFLCRNQDGTYRIPKDSILYFMSEGRKVTCVARSRSYTFYARLDAVGEDVGRGFVRIHQRYLVRALAVQHITATDVEIGGEKLPISRAYQKEALRCLTRVLLD